MRKEIINQHETLHHHTLTLPTRHLHKRQSTRRIRRCASQQSYSRQHPPLERDTSTSAIMVNKILFWSGFGENILQSWRNITVSNLLHAGLAVRFWQLGIEMRPFFQRENWLIYPIYGGLGASFGYWLQGVEDRQMRYLSETRQRLIEKRKRRAQREGAPEVGTYQQREQEGLHASPRFVVERDALALPAESVKERTAVDQ